MLDLWYIYLYVLIFAPKFSSNVKSTGKSLSEALIFAAHGENMLCTEIVLNVKNNFCTQHVLPMFWARNFHVLNLYFNEQSVVILWVSWCKNKNFWQIFTCIWYILDYNKTNFWFSDRNSRYCDSHCWGFLRPSAFSIIIARSRWLKKS